ncbi:MAG: cofactor-independent phosphoglycerate mutase [Candidatus Omnitrophota bacterium]
MKYIVLVPDGMADEPIEQLGGKTPLEAAQTPHMDYIVKNGILAQTKTIPDKFAPASDVANLSILGYDPAKYYSGRAPLEAAYLGVDLKSDEVAFRCNLVTVSEEKMADYSAGHISTGEAASLIQDIDKEIGDTDVRFFPGVSYRHLLVLKGGDVGELVNLTCYPPHDILNKPIVKFLPKGKGAKRITELMNRSRAFLASHEINKVRVDLKENPANMIWLWGQGQKSGMPLFKDKFGLSGAVISAVDLIKGIGKIIGLEVINVEGATGYYDTNYTGKAQAALKALERLDFVFVHVEATDEAGHNGDLRMKITSIERFDKMIVGAVLKHFQNRDDYRILVAPDHATPVLQRKHTASPVCVAMMGQGIEKNGFSAFSEAEAKKSKDFFNGHQLMEVFLR